MSVILQDLIFSHREHDTLLNIPRWEVASGEKVFLEGESGSGKSTLLNLIAGILPPTSGQIALLGERLERLNQRQRDRFRAGNIGYIFQQFNLIPYLNAIDNILLAQEFSNKVTGNGFARAQELLEQLQLPESVWRLPGQSLSIGQQQRVAIARALFNSPRLILADEPTSALDQKNRKAFMEILMDLCDAYQSTLIFVSHDPTLASDFDRIDVLGDINKAGA
ncbi:MAG: ABC transporter ATP-binding protein [Thalassolituus sp.]|jgi:putative ABC transport system ATP-binding protein|nr:ABC transporter ATP-binding protein [Thalassolituus sp.]|tara:strand:- start:683 stop:1348 length:666 start_codon:yes stop_codon:yes gene_type:complete